MQTQSYDQSYVEQGRQLQLESGFQALKLQITDKALLLKKFTDKAVAYGMVGATVSSFFGYNHPILRTAIVTCGLSYFVIHPITCVLEDHVTHMLANVRKERAATVSRAQVGQPRPISQNEIRLESERQQ